MRYALGPLLPALVLALVVGGGFAMPSWLKKGEGRGWTPAEPPPPEYRGRGMAPGFTLKELDGLAAVAHYCRKKGMVSNTYPEACVLDADRELVMPRRGTIPDAQWDALFEHEASGHTWGLTHNDNGKGWVRSPGFFRKNGHIVDEAMVGKAPPLKMPRGLLASSARQSGAQ